MTVKPSVRRRCKNCQLIRRNGGRLTCICTKTKKHHQRQG